MVDPCSKLIRVKSRLDPYVASLSNLLKYISLLVKTFNDKNVLIIQDVIHNYLIVQNRVTT